MSEVPTTEELLTDLHTRFTRVERAILGDSSIGHVGLVTRVERIELEHTQIPAIHQNMEDRRIDGDRRIHERLDKHEDATSSKLDQNRVATDDRADAIEKKIDRFIWITIGASISTFGLGWWAAGGSVPVP